MVNGFSLYEMKKKNLSERSVAQKIKFSIKNFFSASTGNGEFARIY